MKRLSLLLLAVSLHAFGFLTRPLLPQVDGLDRFKGPVVHSGEWDDSIALDGKKVVLVGTGATAAQIATNVGARAKHLTVIQRQTNYMLPDPKVMMTVDPMTVRTPQRIAAGKFSVNGVPLAPDEKTIAMGKRVADYRATIAVNEIKKLIGPTK